MKDDDDEWLAAFAAANAELPPEPFAAKVMRRVRFRLWVRGVVIGGACVLGVVSALAPLHDLVDLVATGLSTVGVQWRETSWYTQYGLPFLFLSVGLSWPILARWLAR
jgi:hypothetical protein